MITAVGDEVDGAATRVIDADGLLVTPGFVDIHCHYDGQATWDTRMIPSSWHGVTTVVVGNCGVGFAPVRPADHERLIELMEGVEDIPGTVLHEGLDWHWQSFPEFMDALDGRPFDVDVALQVPHGALRLNVMGERGARREAATPEDIERMATLAAEGIERRRARVHDLAHDEPPHEHGRVHADAHRRGRRARRHRAGDRAHRPRRAASGVSDFADVDAEFAIFRRMAETLRPADVVLARADRRTTAGAGSSNCSRRRTPTA